ncbi:9243_t:CDS:2 [Entrophospora sp. SA101]|nr:9243_t:CDS:2 [Entrophospora sp. SA101]
MGYPEFVFKFDNDTSPIAKFPDNVVEASCCHPFTGWTALVTLIMAEKY